jgi:hypothetical protein
MHAISKAYGVRLEEVESFADFFCSFTQASEGLFPLILSPEDIEWPQKGNGRLLTSEVLKHLLDENYYKQVSPTPDYEPALTVAQLMVAIERRVVAGAGIRRLETSSFDSLQELIEVPSLSERACRFRRKRVQASFVEATSSDEGTAAANKFVHLSVINQYGRNLYRSLLKVASDGTVEMITDDELDPYSGPLPIATYKFGEDLNIGSLKCLSRIPYHPFGMGVADSLDLSKIAVISAGNGQDTTNADVITIGPGTEENRTQREGQHSSAVCTSLTLISSAMYRLRTLSSAAT